MRRYQKWVVTLGIVAVTPGVTWAGPFDSLFTAKKSTPAAADAESIARALRKAHLNGFDIEIEFKDGLATLKGKIADANQKAAATAAVSSVPGVSTVNNELEVLEGPSPASIEQQAAASCDPNQNQRVAQEIANRLSGRQFRGYDIEIRYQDGVAILGGTVGSPKQREAAEKVARGVQGVQEVQNFLTVNGEPQAPSGVQQAGGFNPAMAPLAPVAAMAGQMGPIQQVQGQMPMPNITPQQAAMMQQQQAIMMQQQAAMMQPPTYGHPGSGASHQVYNQPNLPEHAWPAMASYPNSAQISYPTEYSPSAWPYIGPFYPYPQIPLGWRQVQMEWDDGYWSLNFRPRTERWWWFLNSKNW